MKISLLCVKCLHDWEEPFDAPMTLDKFIEAQKDIVCPLCGVPPKNIRLTSPIPRPPIREERKP